MSWLYSQALVAAFLEENSLDGDASAQLSVMPTQHKFWRNDKPMDASTLSRFGLTCAVLTEGRGEDLLTWYREAFLARTSASPEMELESTAQEADSGERWPGSLAKYDRATCSWKTAQLSLLGDLEPCSVTWPRSGLMLDGQCWELPTLERRTDASESGYWPTPNAMQATSDVNFRCSGDGRTKPNKLGWAVAEREAIGPKTPPMWPTPTVCGNHNRKGASKTSGDGLATVVAQRTWPTPTPTATAHKGWSPNHKRANTDDRLDYSVEREAFQPGRQTPPRRLNPEWVAWLMGWPIGHTSLKPLEMDKFREYERQHGECLTYGEAANV